MTLDECKKQLAKKNEYKSWNHVPFGLLEDELATLYAKSKWDEACEAQHKLDETTYGIEFIAPKPEFNP